MNAYLLLKIAHSLIAVLLTLGVVVHLLMVWKVARAGDGAQLTRKLERTRRFSLPAFAVLAVALPISGWWLVNLGGFALNQTWLWVSSLLLIPLFVAGLLLAGRLRAWAIGGHPPQSAWSSRLAAIYGLLILLLLLAIMGLMGAKPL